jgi:predicted lipoprotein with Yx(FWY)xxD motif
MFMRLLLIVPLLFLALAGSVAMAQDDTTVKTAEAPDLGAIFTDAEGMTLYIFLNDEPNSGESTCYDQCEENWPVFSADEPLTLPDGVPGELGTIERTDGTMQVTYNGWPLYYWVKDVAPGDVTGQAVGDVWYVAIPAEGDATPGAGLDAVAATPAASPAAAGTTVATMDSDEYGAYLTDAEGMALYIFTNDVPDSGESACYDQCEENWPVLSAEEPLTLPEGVPGELGLIERTDGTMQVTYNGWPLYYWVKDVAPGDTTGHGVGDVWYLINPSESGLATPAA